MADVLKTSLLVIEDAEVGVILKFNSTLKIKIFQLEVGGKTEKIANRIISLPFDSLSGYLQYLVIYL